MFESDNRLGAARYLERWEARTAHTIGEHLGRRETDRFTRAMPTWKNELRSSFSQVPIVVTHFCIEYLDPLLKELREHPEELFKRVDSEVGRRPARASVSHNEEEVFVVHGHNHKLKGEVVDFLHRIHGKRPTILHEKPDAGRTIIEKLEHFADRACFAVVLLTADDPRFKKEALLRTKFPEKRPRRARQNVILELGYFWAKLGRGKVVILHEKGVELPSDADGVLYKRVDESGAWKQELAKEMKNAGLPVDLSSAS